LRRVGGVGQRQRARASGFHSVRIRLLVFERPEDAIQARRETIEMILSAQVGAGSAEFTQPFLSALIEGLQIYWRARRRIVARTAHDAMNRSGEIGRASCRERV